MRNYTESYDYDPVGNFQELVHTATGGGWTRTYAYDEPTSRRRTTGSPRPPSARRAKQYTYDTDGNIESMPHLSLMQWDWNNQPRSEASQIVDEGDPQTTYYSYDATGRRVRKVTDNQNGARVSERIYLGGYEIYREYESAGAVTLERHSSTSPTAAGASACSRRPRSTATGGGRDDPTTAGALPARATSGSAVLELDETAAIITYEEYYPYGSTSFQTGRHGRGGQPQTLPLHG